MKKLLGFLMMISLLLGLHVGAFADTAVTTARPSATGALHVEGVSLADLEGNQVQLRGLSTHGLTWYSDFVSEELFQQVAGDWNCNMIRLAMYSELYAGDDREESLRLMRKGIEAAISADLYALVDWHILNDENPNENLESAKEFFSLITSEYPDCPNLIYEICNEPNGRTRWDDVMVYANEIIPLIRQNSPNSVIVVGTPEYDCNLADAVLRPLEYDNLMYTLHFYTATHGEGLRGELEAALKAGLPVFITECGVSESSGDGALDFGSAAEWFQMLNEHHISYAVWSLSNKDESSALLKPDYHSPDPIRYDDLTAAGLWVRELIRGAEPDSIPVLAQRIAKSNFDRVVSWITRSLGERGFQIVKRWPMLAVGALGLLLCSLGFGLLLRRSGKKTLCYDDLYTGEEHNADEREIRRQSAIRILLIISIFCTMIYLGWRMFFSVPFGYGAIAVGGNLVLLAVELLGFAESLVLYRNLLGLREHPLPEIPDEDWPDVDIFIATYNEPVELLYRTVNGCRHLSYPDPEKVHIWVCDDNRRPEMRALAEKMGVGYFDRPDNQGSKAGNLNHAMALTSAPYIVTLDADMIPQRCFLLNTIPYFVDAQRRCEGKSAEEHIRLGLLQTPQAFYEPDVFQHALYSERRAPNEQDFFYRTIEPAKTTTNSVIYGGSNTVLSRQALEDIGGFYTGSITEDFATGLLIESAGYVSLALPDPLASGQTPHTFREHIQQRTRWGRGVIVSARKLNLLRRKGLTPGQKLSYWSSVIYWYSPLKSLIYMFSPLLFALFAVPVFRCNWLELLIFWLPMYLLQDLSLRLASRGEITHKWSGIYETSIMMHLLIPILKETVGITLSTFKVTDKSGKSTQRRQTDWRTMLPFLVLELLCFAGFLRVLFNFEVMQTINLLILLFWVVRNQYYLLMAMFLVDGREYDGEAVKVYTAEPVNVTAENGRWDGVTTKMTEHSLTVFLDESEALPLGMAVHVTVDTGCYRVELDGSVTNVSITRSGTARTHTVEILDYGNHREEYLQILYDRVPTLPQSLHHDFGIFTHLWQNIAHRVARTRR